MGRRESREAAVKLIFACSFCSKQTDGEPSVEERIQLYRENLDDRVESETENDYLSDIVRGVLAHEDQLDILIQENAKGWSLDRMARLDIAILRVAVYEMLYREDIPSSVAINEAVEIAKKYSHEDAGTFVNGILGGIYKKWESGKQESESFSRSE